MVNVNELGRRRIIIDVMVAAVRAAVRALLCGCRTFAP
jgi:hypothetical protein